MKHQRNCNSTLQQKHCLHCELWSAHSFLSFVVHLKSQLYMATFWDLCHSDNSLTKGPHVITVRAFVLIQEHPHPN